MDPAISQIIVAAITVCVPALVTILTTRSVKKQANKHSARQSILQLIIEDKVRVIEKGLPENYQAVLDEFDEYQKSGGNSYIHEKVEEYKKWYNRIVKEKKNEKAKQKIKKG